jgi:hypothetical protein
LLKFALPIIDPFPAKPISYFLTLKTIIMKNVVVHFDFPELKPEQYDAVWNDLKAKGYDHPQGLLFHVGAPTPSGGFLVTDVWQKYT